MCTRNLKAIGSGNENGSVIGCNDPPRSGSPLIICLIQRIAPAFQFSPASVIKPKTFRIQIINKQASGRRGDGRTLSTRHAGNQNAAGSRNNIEHGTVVRGIGTNTHILRLSGACIRKEQSEDPEKNGNQNFSHCADSII